MSNIIKNNENNKQYATAKINFVLEIAKVYSLKNPNIN